MAGQAPDISRRFFGGLLAKAHTEAGRVEEALFHLEAFAAVDFSMPVDQIWLTGMVDYADAAIESGEARFCEPLYDQLLPFARQVAATGGSCLGPVAEYLGGLATVLGRTAEAHGHLDVALAIASGLDAPFMTLRSELLLGRLLQTCSPADKERGMTLLESVEDRAGTAGYGDVARRAAAALSH